MSQETFFQQTLEALEWPRLLELLASQAHSTLGADSCRSLPLAESCVSAQQAIHETSEMIALGEGAHPLPVLTFQDCESSLVRAEKGAGLDAKELRSIANVLVLITATQRSLSGEKETAPHLFGYVEHLENLSFLQSEIDQCISPEGEILDHATSALYDAIQEAQGLKTRMRQRLESMMTSSQYRDVLREPYFAQRENRYVLPSGLTVFLEPRELIEFNNRIKVAELEVAREIHRILVELTSMIIDHTQTIRQYLRVLTILDSIGAKARLSQRMKAQPVQLFEDGRIRLSQARHPLLILARHEVIPNDLVFEHDQRILVISGPNTGGKTVTLKLLGLYSLMVRAGLHLPCGEGSEMGFFAETYADIGDAQDLARDLSSFSAQLSKITTLLDLGHSRSSGNSRPILVLLDEVISSTDPAEGAALAEAILLTFAQLEFKVVVTTHYNSLKTLALSSPGFLNASLEFDVATLTPTYRLIQGVPGGSSALDIAARLGMSPDILKHASELMYQQDRQLDHIFADLQNMHHRLRQELEDAEKHRQNAEQSFSEIQDRLAQLRATERDEVRKIKKKFKEELTRARTEISQVLTHLQQNKTLMKAREAKQQVQNIEMELSHNTLEERRAIPLDSLPVGGLVEISNLGTYGILLERPQGKKRVRLRIGDSELSVAVEHLIGRSPEDDVFSPAKKKPDSPSKRIRPQGFEEPHFVASGPSGLFTIDLRGKTVEEAVESLVSRLDEAVLTHAKSVEVIHGHGTGKLKTAVRQYLSTSSYVESFRRGVQGEGGDGVTIVELK